MHDGPGPDRLTVLERAALEAERNRVSPADGEASLSSDTDYASPFVAMPF